MNVGVSRMCSHASRAISSRKMNGNAFVGRSAAAIAETSMRAIVRIIIYQYKVSVGPSETLIERLTFDMVRIQAGRMFLVIYPADDGTAGAFSVTKGVGEVYTT